MADDIAGANRNIVGMAAGWFRSYRLVKPDGKLDSLARPKVYFANGRGGKWSGDCVEPKTLDELLALGGRGDTLIWSIVSTKSLGTQIYNHEIG